MTTTTTPKTAAFRSILAKTAALHADIRTLDDAIRERDAIRARMGECRDETEARKHLGDLMRAEETVTVKQVRDPHLQAVLADLLAETKEAFLESHAEVAAIVRDAPKAALAAFQDMLRSAQLDPDRQKLEQTNPIVAEAIRPNELAKLQEDKLSEAWRTMSLSDAPLSKQVEGFQSALEWHDKALAAHVEIAAEDKRMVAACDAFRKVLAKN